MWTLPNILTAARIVMIPFIIFLMIWGTPVALWAALGVYTLACVTDFFDGYLARQRQEETALGKFLDPIADKLLVATLLMMLVGADRLEGYWILSAIVILFREILVSGLREFLGATDVKLPVSVLAKWKTTIQMFSLGFLIMGEVGNAVLPHNLLIGQVGVSIAAALTAITGYQYLKAGFLHIRKMDLKKAD
jgi:cardiolipin synthase